MKLIYIIPYFLLLFILPLTHAIPSGEPQRFYDWDGSSHRGECLNDEQADKILKNWISFFVQADPVLINKTVSPTFHFYSGTSNFIQQYGANKGPNDPAVSSRAEFLAAQVTQTGSGGPPSSFTVYGTFHDCSHITFRWGLINSGNRFVPTGIDVIILEEKTFLIREAWTEWNAATVFYNAGLCDLSQFGCTKP